MNPFFITKARKDENAKENEESMSVFVFSSFRVFVMILPCGVAVTSDG